MVGAAGRTILIEPFSMNLSRLMTCVGCPQCGIWFTSLVEGVVKIAEDEKREIRNAHVPVVRKVFHVVGV